jgi:hypothetical protein
MNLLISDEELQRLVSKYLGDFYKARLQRIQTLNLRSALSKKNPYLFKAIGTENASEIVEYLLNAILSSSDETIFGNTFFEPIAIVVSGGRVGGSDGVDFATETESKYVAYAVKSGANWGNASQKKRLQDEFLELRNRLYKIHKQFEAVVGHGYGLDNTPAKNKKIWRDVSGQAFWKEITGDEEFYLRLIRFMRDEPQKHRAEFKKGWDQTVNRFTREFIDDFCRPDGAIDWERLTKFVSEESRQTRAALVKKYQSLRRYGRGDGFNNESIPDGDLPTT